MFMILIGGTIASCSNPQANTTADQEESSVEAQRRMANNSVSSFLPMDSANIMIQSYLSSVGYPKNDDSLLSLSVNADDLRAFLADSSITDIKLMFAHRMDYINNGNSGEYCGYSPDGLTLILAAYDANGDYIFHDGDQVMNRMAPCPPSCPIGTAAKPLLVNESRS